MPGIQCIAEWDGKDKWDSEDKFIITRAYCVDCGADIKIKPDGASQVVYHTCHATTTETASALIRENIEGAKR